MRAIVRLGLATCVLAGLAGCAGPPADEPERVADAGPVTPRPSPTLRSIGETCTRYADAFCRASTASCEPWSLKPYRDAVECVGALRAQCVTSAQLPGTVPDLDAMETCARALAEPGCGKRLLALRSPACRPPAGVRRGKLPPGAPCHENAQCSTGTCNFEGVVAKGCGECVIPSHPGQFCLDDTDCRRGGSGTPDEGLYCDIAIHACAPRNEVGGGCKRDGECVDGLECLGRVCAVGTTPAMFPCGDGASGCGPWGRCASEDGEGPRCWPITFGEEGAPCSEKSATDLRRCRGALVCRFGTCQAARKPGEACTVGTADCGPGAACVEGTCARFSALCGQ